MSTKDQVAEDVERAAQAGGPQDRLTRLIEAMVQQSAQTNALLLRLLPAGGAPPTQALPPAAPRLTDRQEVCRLVDEHCHQTQENHRDVWRWLFRQWQRTGRGDSRTRLEDVAMAGDMADFLAFAGRELPRKPAHRDAEPAPRKPAPEQVNPVLAMAIEDAKIDPAELARRSGLSLETIKRALKGNIPGQRTRQRIAIVLGKTAADLWPAKGSAEEEAFARQQMDRMLAMTKPDKGR